MSTQRSRWDLYAFCVWIALLPIPLGSNRTWALAITLPILFLIGVVVAWRRRDVVSGSLPATLIGWPGATLLVFLLVLVLQLVPIGSVPLSASAQRTVLYLLIALGSTVSFWLVLALARTESDLKVLLYAIVACGALQAMIAVFMMSARLTLTILDSELNSDVAQGTFTNRNHLAAYLNMCLAAGIGLLMGQLAAARPDRNWRQRVRDWVSLLLSGKARLRLVLVLMVIALILTRSRMGNGGFFFGLLLAASIYAFYARTRRRGLMIFVASLIVIDLVFIGAWVGVDKVVERIEQTSLYKPSTSGSTEPTVSGTPEGTGTAPQPANSEESVEQRVDPAIDAIAIVRAHPLLGTGGGTFYLTFMAYTPQDQGFYHHAHNDYLEIAADTGLVGLGALIALALGSVWMSLRILRDRRSEVARAAAFCALMAIACLGLHSFVDFNLQIPANAMMFSIIIALPFATRSFTSRSRNGDGEFALARKRNALAPALAAVSTLVFGWAGYSAIQFGLADLLAIRGNQRMAEWEVSGAPLTPETVIAVQTYMQQAIGIAPRNAEYHETLGNLEYARAASPEATDDERAANLQSAMTHYREALRHARVSPYAWGNLLLAKHRAGEIDAEFRDALRNAARFGPFEPNVQAMIVETGLGNWEPLSAADRMLVAETVKRAWPTNRGSVLREAENARGRESWCEGDGGALKPMCDVLARRQARRSG